MSFKVTAVLGFNLKEKTFMKKVTLLPVHLILTITICILFGLPTTIAAQIDTAISATDRQTLPESIRGERLPHQQQLDELRQLKIPVSENSSRAAETSGQTGQKDQSAAGNLNLDGGFAAGVDDGDGRAAAVALQADGKLLVGGKFNRVNNAEKQYLARINADGSLDDSFNTAGTGFDAEVEVIKIQADGKILVGGFFTKYNGSPQPGIVRLNADGTLDVSFNANAASVRAYDIALQLDGKILVAGVQINANINTTYSLMRFNGDGSLDNSFARGISGDFDIGLVRLQADGKILIGGYFTIYNGIALSRLARLNADGSLDSSFNTGSGFDNRIEDISFQSDGKIVAAGWFRQFNGSAQDSIVRLNPDGSRDASFNCPAVYYGILQSVKILSGGKLIVTGYPRSYTEPQTIRLNSDGSLDASYQAANLAARNLTTLADGSVIVSGSFRNYGADAQNYLLKLNPDGSAANTFRPRITGWGTVYDMTVQADNGKITVGGAFNRAGDQTRTAIARFNPNGTLDTTFNANLRENSSVTKITGEPNGKILIAGNSLFTNNGVPLRGIARLNVDGSLDQSFTSAAGVSSVYKFVRQADGKIAAIGDAFINNAPSQVFRLNADGTLDLSFAARASGSQSFSSIAGQDDGKILVGGYPGVVINGRPSKGIIRLNADGTTDASFNTGSGTDYGVLDIAPVASGKILIAGNFNVFSGTVRRGIARLNADGSLDGSFAATNYTLGANCPVTRIVPLSGGRILATTSRVFYPHNSAQNSPSMALLNQDGSMDSGFLSGFNENLMHAAYAAAVQDDGGILVGGTFSNYGSTIRRSLVRLTAGMVQTRRAAFDFDGDGKTDISVFRPAVGAWYLQQSNNGFSGMQFGISTDRLVPADYDGDGKTDIAVYRNGTWYLQRSAAGFIGIAFGDGNDIPQPADYGGDGKADLAVFRPSNGTWYILNLTDNQFTAFQFGAAGDKPVAADYDGDGKADYAVFRSGIWYIRRSTLGFTGITFGEAADKPVAADYDGDGKTDVAVYRPSNGTWYLNRSALGFTGIPFGIETDLVSPGDYDGDGKTDIAVYRTSGSTWYLQRSQAGLTGVLFGANGDRPVPNAYVR